MRPPVFDLHCDSVLKLVHRGARFGADNAVSHVDIPKMRRGGVDGVTYSTWSDPVFRGEAAFRRTEFMIETALAEIAENSSDLYLVRTAADLDRSVAEGKISALIGIEGGLCLDDRIENLERFFRMGARRLTLTHTQSPSWAGSATDDGKSRGLSDLGRDIVLGMNELGMIVDVAHASEKTTLDACKISRRPVICSHSLARGLFDTDRLATDEMICAVGESGGVFAVTLLSPFFDESRRAEADAWYRKILLSFGDIGEDGTLEERAHRGAALFMDTPYTSEVPPIEGILPHMDYAIDLIGEDHVALGTDLDGFPFGPKGLEDVSKFDNLREAMRRHGYSESRICKILGDNARRVMKEILP